MAARRLATVLLLTFVVFTAGYGVGREVGVRGALRHLGGAGAERPQRAAPARQLVARYYHGTKRCVTCNALEAQAREVLERDFADALASGALVWETANMDEAWNQEAVLEYGLVRSSLVLSDRRDGAEDDYRVLKRLWDLVGDEPAFHAHVREAVEAVFAAWQAEGDAADGDG